MKCTSCKKGTLVPSFIEGQFRAHTCDNCHGNWILIEDYVAWKERNPNYQFANDIQFNTDGTDSNKALLCPITGTIMRKFRISSSTDHRVDYSNAVGGIWLDQGDWELLKEKGLAGTLNAVVTQHWQQQIREQSTKQHFADIYQDKFGKETYDKVKEFRQWLEGQPHKGDLRAYIMAEDPYSAHK